VKTKESRLALQAGLGRINAWLHENEIPDNGVCIFAAEDEMNVVVPQLPLMESTYYCGKQWLDPPQNDQPSFSVGIITGSDAVRVDCVNGVITTRQMSWQATRGHRRGG
jgi:hypothetical protein